jgi:hypothetical protein
MHCNQVPQGLCQTAFISFSSEASRPGIHAYSFQEGQGVSGDRDVLNGKTWAAICCRLAIVLSIFVPVSKTHKKSSIALIYKQSRFNR